jgi:hypothetical protein
MTFAKYGRVITVTEEDLKPKPGYQREPSCLCAWYETCAHCELPPGTIRSWSPLAPSPKSDTFSAKGEQTMATKKTKKTKSTKKSK